MKYNSTTYLYRNAQLPLPPREKMAGRRGQKTNSEGGRNPFPKPPGFRPPSPSVERSETQLEVRIFHEKCSNFK